MSSILLNSNDQVAKVVSQIKGQQSIAVDTEFIRESTFFPKVALLQVATKDKVWLLDPTLLDRKAMQPLLECFEDPKILKIMHAAHADQECLYWHYGILATPVLDTAVGAALCGYGDGIGLGKLLEHLFSVSLPKGRARAKWLQRPLPEELLHYAEQDVAHLVHAGETLRADLEKRDRWEWAIEESEVLQDAFDVPPERMAERAFLGGQVEAKSFGVLVELFRWREKRARDADLPRPWVAANETLMNLARALPRRIDELKMFRGLSPKVIERAGLEILGAIERGKAASHAHPPVRPRRQKDLDEHLSQFVRTFVTYLATRHEIALRYLINMNKAPLLVTLPNTAAWIEEGVLSSRAFELIGSELTEFLEGRQALVLKGSRLEILKIESK